MPCLWGLLGWHALLGLAEVRATDVARPQVGGIDGVRGRTASAGSVGGGGGHRHGHPQAHDVLGRDGRAASPTRLETEAQDAARGLALQGRFRDERQACCCVATVRAQAVLPRTERVSPGHARDRPQERADRGREAPDQEQDPVGEGNSGGTRGSQVKSKAGLNREVPTQNWSLLRSQLRYKAASAVGSTWRSTPGACRRSAVGAGSGTIRAGRRPTAAGPADCSRLGIPTSR